jgi:aminoglycoside 6'-N-acetyltransferase I
MIELGRAHGCEEVWLGTEPDNTAAKAVYGARSDAEPFLMYAWDI